MIEAIRVSGPPLHIEGFPDAVKVLRLTDAKAYRLADLMLHKIDLAFAQDCMATINSAAPGFHREVYWRSAITHFFKCFSTSEARFSLSAPKAYRGEPPEAMQNYLYFLAIRDKHLVHDESALAQSLPGAILNNGSKPYKIEKIVAIAMFTETLQQEEYANFKLLIDHALGWIVRQFDELANILSTELEAQSYEALLARSAMSYTHPVAADIDQTRRR